MSGLLRFEVGGARLGMWRLGGRFGSIGLIGLVYLLSPTLMSGLSG